MKTLEVMDKYLSQHVLRPNTVSKIRNIFRLFDEFSPDFPTSSGYINEWAKWLREAKHLSDISTQRYYTYARSVARFISEQYDIPNPFLKSLVPKYDKHKPRRYFTADQEAFAIRSCTTDIERALIMTLVDSCCRVEDLSGLKASQINHDSFTTSTDKKTGAHTYRLRPELCLILKQIAGSNDSYVFKARSNNQYHLDPNSPASPRALASRVRSILLRAGFTGAKLGAHTFRHSGGSLIAKTTKSALAVKAILGHADIETSMQYIHDAEQDIAQGISPLQIIADSVKANKNSAFNQTEMLTSGESKELIPTSSEPSLADILIQESYPLPPEGTIIQARLNYENILLLRRAFIAICNGTSAIDDPSQSRILWKRMLRKVKLHPNHDPA